MVIDAVIKELPDIVFICFGANDAIDETIAQHVSLDDYEKNLKDMINIITKVFQLQCKLVLYHHHHHHHHHLLPHVTDVEFSCSHAAV